MNEIPSSKPYDLEDRTLEFARRTINFCKDVSRSIINEEILKQLVRAATSVGANYIEANEALSKKDFILRLKICRKEAKESGYWFKLIEANSANLHSERDKLLQESVELMKIFGSILTKNA